MKLDSINWQEITESQARRLIGAAAAREQRLAAAYNESTPENEAEREAAWCESLEIEEALRVLASCGERPSAPVTACTKCMAAMSETKG